MHLEGCCGAAGADARAETEHAVRAEDSADAGADRAGRDAVAELCGECLRVCDGGREQQPEFRFGDAGHAGALRECAEDRIRGAEQAAVPLLGIALCAFDREHHDGSLRLLHGSSGECLLRAEPEMQLIGVRFRTAAQETGSAVFAGVQQAHLEIGGFAA